MNAKQKTLLGFGLVWIAFTLVLVFFVLPMGMSRGILIASFGHSLGWYQKVWFSVLLGGGLINLLFLVYSNRHK